MLQFDIAGAIVKPYVRMTQRGKWVKPEAQAYLTSKAALALQIKTAMNAAGKSMLPEKTPFSVFVWITTPTSQGHRADLDNIFKAIMDACNGVAFPDDRWVDSFTVNRDFGYPNLKMMIIKLDGTE